MEWLDLQKGEWVPLKKSGDRQLGKGWQQFTFVGTVREFDGDAHRVSLDQIERDSFDEAEILSVKAQQGSEESYLFKEREAFSIVVDTLFRHDLPGADVTLKITRSDGVHAYWTSCGEQGFNLDGSCGRKQVVFKFEKNYLGAGSYSVSIQIASKFNYPEEWPYKQLYTKAFDAFKFTIVPEKPLVNKGVLNRPVEITVSDLPDLEEHETQPLLAVGHHA